MLCWEAKETILPSTLVQFYIQMGAVVDEFQWAIQYCKAKPLAGFIRTCTENRIRADESNKPHLAQLNKLLLNSTYGRTTMVLSNRTKIEFGNGNFDGHLIRKKYLKHIKPIYCESDDLVSWQYEFSQRQYVDSIPVHIGNVILNMSKYHILQTLVNIHSCMSMRHMRLCYMDTGLFTFNFYIY